MSIFKKIAHYSHSKSSIIGLAESFNSELIVDKVFKGINHPEFTWNKERKNTLNTDSKPVIINKRSDVKAVSQDHIANRRINQIEKRKFRIFSSFKGRIIQIMYGLFSKIFIFVLRKNRKRKIDME